MPRRRWVEVIPAFGKLPPDVAELVGFTLGTLVEQARQLRWVADRTSDGETAVWLYAQAMVIEAALDEIGVDRDQAT